MPCIENTDISYTEKEYKYAVGKGMPVLAFLHENIDQLPAYKVGATDEEREKVKNFCIDVKNAGRLVDFYSDSMDLKYKIAMAMPKIINDVPTYVAICQAVWLLERELQALRTWRTLAKLGISWHNLIGGFYD